MGFSDTAEQGRSIGQTPKGDNMNYLDVRLVAGLIEGKFGAQARTCKVDYLGTTSTGITFKMASFSNVDLHDMQRTVLRHDMIITSWDVELPYTGSAHVNVHIGLSEVNDNGQSG